MAEEETSPGRSLARPASARSQQLSLLAMESVMREEIRELHEQRAAAMMTEIVDLQKEKDLAMAKVRRLEKKMKDLEAEVEKKRESNGGGGRAELVALLRQTLLEEQLLSADLRRKLQTAKKQNLALTQQVRNETPENSSPGQRRHSFDGRSPKPPPSPLTPTTGGQSSGYSPTVVARRYKLATVASCDASTQTTTPAPVGKTDQSDHSFADNLAPPIEEALTKAQADIVQLKRERDEEREKTAKEVQKREALKRESESLEEECGELRDSLAELSRWVRGKLGGLEENMDIFRIIYSLHSSLSQEQSVLQELQRKLQEAELKILQLDQANRQLALESSEAEENHKNSLAQIRALKEKLCSRPPLHPSLLLTPPPPHPSLKKKGRKFSSPQLPAHHTHHDII